MPQAHWDEDRYGYPEATHYGREMSRSRTGYRAEQRFADEDPSRSQLYRPGGHGIPASSEYGSDSSLHQASGYADGQKARSGDRGSPQRYRPDDTMPPYSHGDTGPRRYGRRLPKGYTRSDECIRDDVCEHLFYADDVDAAEVSVEAQAGTVKLEGTVPKRRMKHRIEDIAEQCIGVVDVHNRIRVVSPAQTQAQTFGSAAAEHPGESRNDRGSGTGPPRH